MNLFKGLVYIILKQQLHLTQKARYSLNNYISITAALL